MNDFYPKVTIVIPVYNGANYLSDAIDSALLQTYKNIEIIVVNDGSTDNTEDIILSYNSKVKYLKKENGGVSSALNLAIKNMSGDYFSWLSHDDLYSPFKIEKQIKALSNLENKNTIIICNADTYSKDLKLVKHNKIPIVAQNHMSCFLGFNQDIGLNGCALLIKKDLFSKYGLFNEDLKATQDYDMWFRFCENEQFFLIDTALVKSRQHSMQTSKIMPNIIFETDNLHSKIISTITLNEFIDFSSNIRHAKKYYEHYLLLNYRKSSISTLIIYINLLLKSNKKHKAIKYVKKQLELKNNQLKDSYNKIISLLVTSSNNEIHISLPNTKINDTILVNKGSYYNMFKYQLKSFGIKVAILKTLKFIFKVKGE